MDERTDSQSDYSVHKGAVQYNDSYMCLFCLQFNQSSQ